MAEVFCAFVLLSLVFESALGLLAINVGFASDEESESESSESSSLELSFFLFLFLLSATYFV